MSQENVETLRRALEAFNRGDIDAAVANIAPECEYFPSGGVPDLDQVYRGPEGYAKGISWLRDEFDDVRVEVHDLIDAGDKVVVAITNRGRGRQSGIETSWDIWQVWTWKDGKAVHGQAFTSEQEALEAAGLQE